MQTAYFDQVGNIPEELAKFTCNELLRWEPVIGRIGLKPYQESRTNAELTQSSLAAKSKKPPEGGILLSS